MSYVPTATIVDISHHIARDDLRQASYLLLSAYPHFPKGSVHIVMVDVFAGDQPRMLLAEKDGSLFIVPDNGILPLAFGQEIIDTCLVHEFTGSFVFGDWINIVGGTVKAINTDGNLPYPPATIRNVPGTLLPKAMPDGFDCNILYIDRYENVVLDITKSQFEAIVGNHPFRIKVMRQTDLTVICNNYNDVPEGHPLCRFNLAGFLEIAINRGRAASFLGLSSDQAANLRYRTIKIFIQNNQQPTNQIAPYL